MRITNKQIFAEIICTQGDTCEGCPFYGIEDCSSLRGNGFDIYKDILDDRELIKEMREALKGFSKGTCFCECGIDNPMLIGKHDQNCLRTNAILEKSKGYA